MDTQRPNTENLLRQRLEQLTAWLSQHCPHCEHEQAHLKTGSGERAYWHYGYLTALRDVLLLLAGKPADPPPCTEGRSS